jgi:hypothetical protein
MTHYIMTLQWVTIYCDTIWDITYYPENPVGLFMMKLLVPVRTPLRYGPLNYIP